MLPDLLLRRWPAQELRSNSAGFYLDAPRYDDAYHRVQVSVSGRPDLSVRYRQGYTDAKDDADPKRQLREAVENPLDATQIALAAEIKPASGGGYDVNIRIGIADVDLQDEGGRRRGQIRVILAQRDESGQELDQRDLGLLIDLQADRYEVLRSSGLECRQSLLPIPHAMSLRVLVLDDAGDLGSVTIPLPANRN